MPASPIFESFYQDRSRSGATDLCINIFPERSSGGNGPELGLFLNCPGLTAPVATVGTGPIRAAYRAADGLLYVCSGSELYVLDTNYSATLIGSILSSAGRVSMVDNATQVGVFDGFNGWCVTKATRALVMTIPNGTTSATVPTSGVYQDGFCIVNSSDNQIYQSGLNNLLLFTTSGTANNAFVQGNAEPVIGLGELKREVWVFKKDVIEIWINQGNAGFAFVALQGVYIHAGCAAPGSIARLGDSLVWLGEDEQGNAVVYQSQGYQAAPISTYALSATFNNFDVISDAIAYTYQMDNHRFYVLTFPNANATYCYDLMTGKWHQRASFSDGDLNREIINCHAFFNKKHIVGDYQNGNLYALDNDTYTDNGTTRKWLRSWRALPPSAPIGPLMSFDELQILMETGITTASGTNPQIMLRWSDDGGYTWTPIQTMAAGAIGETAWRVIARRLGSVKIGTGQDRVWEISSTDPQRTSITGAMFEGGQS